MGELQQDPQPKLLRTVLRADVYDRLLLIAQRLSTGRGHWDFGVAIERLLDYAEQNEKFEILEQRIGELEMELLHTGEEEPQDEENSLGLIGTRFRKGEKNGEDRKRS